MFFDVTLDNLVGIILNNVGAYSKQYGAIISTIEWSIHLNNAGLIINNEGAIHINNVGSIF
jgi:hypothetical protein